MNYIRQCGGSGGGGGERGFRVEQDNCALCAIAPQHEMHFTYVT